MDDVYLIRIFEGERWTTVGSGYSLLWAVESVFRNYIEDDWIIVKFSATSIIGEVIYDKESNTKMISEFFVKCDWLIEGF